MSLAARFAAAQRLAERSTKQWGKLCEHYLPVTAPNSMWRYSRRGCPGDLNQGWKLHISATVLTANTVLSRVAPFLQARSVLFKAPASLDELRKINCGLFYGYSQVGKFITVYPQSDQEAISLARELHDLTHQLSAPLIPFDLRYERDSCVYYRYGGFQSLEIVYPDGSRMAAIRDRDGNLIADRRYSETAKPDWITDPFPRDSADSADKSASPLTSTYVSFAALVQRGKGGVYKAIDRSDRGPRLCIIKEGRKDGEVNWDGRDGHWRVTHETRVLKSLRRRGVPVPEVYDSFEVEQNQYLVTEFIAGDSLETTLQRRRKRCSIKHALTYSLELARLIGSIHSCGWTWRDCKPANIILTPRGLRPLDFEGACPVSANDPVPWGTTPFVPPEWQTPGAVRSGVHDDVYALGAVMYLLLYGKLPDETPRRQTPPTVGAALRGRPLVENTRTGENPLTDLTRRGGHGGPPLQLAPMTFEPKRRKGIPSEVKALVWKLLDSNAEHRPGVEAVVRVLSNQLRLADARFMRCESAINLGSECSSAKIGSTSR